MPDVLETRLGLLRLSQLETFPYKVSVCGHSFFILENVFSPRYFESPEVFTFHFPYQVGDVLLEMGCGAGFTSIIAALKGAKRVLALDCSPAAIQNTALNISLHSVERIVTVRESDLFASIDPGERFETIYWNMPWVYAPESRAYCSLLERSLIDPGYRQINRFLQEARRFLASKGRLIVGFGNFGDVDTFYQITDSFGYEVEVLHQFPSAHDPKDVYFLYQLIQ